MLIKNSVLAKASAVLLAGTMLLSPGFSVADGGQAGVFISASAAETDTSSSSESLKWNFDSKTGELTISGSGNMQDYFHSSFTPWYRYRNDIKSVKIEEGIVYIGDSAFSNLENITRIELPESVVSIGDSAFRQCTSVTEIKFGSKLETVGRSAFAFTAIKSLTLPSSLKKIQSAFCSCESLKTVTIPDGCNYTLEGTFFECTELERVTIGKDTNVNDETFSNCTSIKSYTVSAENPYICSSNGHLYSKDMSKLYFYANGNGATTTTLSTRVTEIGDSAFLCNPTMKSVTLPPNLKSIGKSAFYGTKIETFVFRSNQMSSVGRFTFYGTPWFNSQPDGMVYAGTVAYKYKGDVPESVSIKSGTLGLADYCFYEMKNLKHVGLPKGLLHIGSYAFNQCENLTEIELPAGLESIDESAFEECTSLTSVNIPDSVTVMGKRCFYGCSALKSVRLSQNMTVLPERALALTGLTGRITIPAKVEIIENEPFYQTNNELKISILNRDCIFNDNSRYRFCGTNTTLCGYKDSTTQDFARKKNIDFIELSEYTLGDVNEDDSIDVYDALKVARFDAGLDDLSDTQKQAGDVNGDGDTNVADALQIARYDAGIITEFPSV